MPVPAGWVLMGLCFGTSVLADAEFSRCSQSFYKRAPPAGFGGQLQASCRSLGAGRSLASLHSASCDITALSAFCLHAEWTGAAGHGQENDFGDEKDTGDAKTGREEEDESQSDEEDLPASMPAVLRRDGYTVYTSSDTPANSWDALLSELVKNNIHPQCRTLGGDLYVLTGSGGAGELEQGCEVGLFWSAMCCADPDGEAMFGLGVVKVREEEARVLDVKGLEEVVGVGGVFLGGCGEDDGGEGGGDITLAGFQNALQQIIEMHGTDTQVESSDTLAESATQPDSSDMLAESAAQPDTADTLAESATQLVSSYTLAEIATQPDSSDTLAESATQLVSSDTLAEIATQPDSSDTLAESAAQPDTADMLAESATQLVSSDTLAEIATQPDSTDTLAESATQPDSSDTLAESATQPVVADTLAESNTQPDSADTLAESNTQPDSSDTLTESATQSDSTDMLAESATQSDSTDTLAENATQPVSSDMLAESATLPDYSDTLAESATQPVSTDTLTESATQADAAESSLAESAATQSADAPSEDAEGDSAAVQSRRSAPLGVHEEPDANASASQVSDEPQGSSTALYLLSSSLWLLSAPLRPVASTLSQIPGQVTHVIQEDLSVLSTLPGVTLSLVYNVVADAACGAVSAAGLAGKAGAACVSQLYYCTSRLAGTLLSTLQDGVVGVGTLTCDGVGIVGGVANGAWSVSRYVGGRAWHESTDFLGAVVSELGSESTRASDGLGKLALKGGNGVVNVVRVAGRIVGGMLSVAVETVKKAFGGDRLSLPLSLV